MEKPVNAPKGWHSKKVFIDTEGNEWSYGKLVKAARGSSQDTPPAEAQEPTKVDTPTVQPDTTVPIPNPAPQLKYEEPTMNPKKSEVEALRQQVEELRRIVLMQGQQPTTVNVKQETKPFGDYDDSEIPADDFLEEPEVYVVYGRGYCLSAYFKDGRETKSPNNAPIYFKRAHDEVTYHEENARIIPFSQYVCKSKAISKFIRQSPYYGITVCLLKDSQKLKSVDMSRVDKYEAAIISVQRMTDSELFSNCVSRGIETRSNKDGMRAELIRKMIAAYEMQDSDLLNIRKNDMIKEVMEKPQT